MPYIGRGPGFGVRSRFIYTATASQTSFSGNDDAGITLAYTDTLYMDVYQNGVLLVPATDYAASTGTSVVLVQGASVGDTVEMLVYDIFSVADAVSAKDGGTFSGTIAAAGLSTSSLGTSNFRAGVNAGDSITAGGNYNVVIGDEAGTALTTGDDNVAIGFEALSTEDTGTRAVAVGYRALKTQNNDSTNYNIAIGYDAGLSVTTGTQNVIIGGKAGDALTVGDDNVAIGRAALTTDTQGSKSVAVGMNALATQNFTSANDSYNTAVGYNAGTATTTATNNTLIGGAAGDTITTGPQNTACGRNGLTAVTTGAYNSGFGYAAGSAITTGNYCTSVGGNANTTTTTAEGVTIVGYNCQPSGATVGNELVIATNGMTGKGSQTAFINGGNGPTFNGNNTTTFAQTSDRRIKKDIIPNNKGLESIKQIEPKYFYYKSDEEMQAELPDAKENLPLDKQFTSAIAQELKEIFPEAIEERTKNKIMSVNTDPIFWSMVNAIKEISEKNDALEARLATLEAK